MKSHWKHRLLSVILAVCLVFSQSMIHASSHAEGASTEPEVEEAEDACGVYEEHDSEEKVAVDDVSPGGEGRAIFPPNETASHKASVTIGEETTLYTSFWEAFYEAENQIATIQLLASAYTDRALEVVGENTNNTLDLHGQKIIGTTSENFDFENVILISDGSLTIKDSGTDGGIEDDCGRNCVYVTENGELIIEKGIIGKVDPTTADTRARALSSYAVKVDNGAKAIVKGGSVASLYVGDNGFVEISNGYIYNYERAANATVSISGGYFKNPVEEEDCAIGYIPTTTTVSAGVTGDWYSVERCEHTVTFKTNDGSFTEEKTIGHRGTVSAPVAPTRDGYALNGWYTDEGCTNLYDFSTLVTDDLTLYANWEAISYTVSAETDGDGGTVSSSKNSASIGDTITLTATPEDGFHFKEWNVEAGGVTITNNEFTMPASDVKVKAVFEKHSGGTATCTQKATCEFCHAEYGNIGEHDWNDVVYTWDENAQSCTAKRICKTDESHTEDVTATVTSARTKAPTCTEMGETTYTATFTETWAATQSKTLTNIPVVDHQWNQGECTECKCKRIEIIRQPANKTVSEGGSALFDVAAKNAVKSEALSYQWQESTDQGVAWTDISGATNVSYKIDAAEISMNTYQYRCIVSIAGSTDRVTSNGATLTVKKPTPTVHPGDEEATYCTLTFDTNGGSSLNGVRVVYGSRLDVSKYITTREGYEFSGWYTDQELTKEFDPNTAITHSMILYAKWTEKEPEDIKTGIIAEIPVQTDNGDEQQPDVKVTCGDKTLTEDTDYHVTYKNNEEPGKATVVITGSGKYTGELTQDFIIVPRKVTGLQAVKKTTTTLKLTFDKVRGADGYEIYDAESDVHIASCSTQKGAEKLVRTLTDLTPGELRQYKVRAYVLVDGKRYYGEFSDVYSQATDVAKPVLMATIVKSGRTAQTLQWNKISQADGYIIYGCKCGGSGKKLKTIKGSSTTKWTKRNLSPGKYYKYYVAAYQNIDGSQTDYVKSSYAHAVTTSSKYTNPSKITVNRSSITLARKKTTTIKASVTIPTGKTIRQHCGKVRYKTSDKTIATVTSTGKIKGIYTGTCYIYAYTQNGLYKRIKVTVK